MLGQERNPIAQAPFNHQIVFDAGPVQPKESIHGHDKFKHRQAVEAERIEIDVYRVDLGSGHSGTPKNFGFSGINPVDPQQLFLFGSDEADA